MLIDNGATYQQGVGPVLSPNNVA